MLQGCIGTWGYDPNATEVTQKNIGNIDLHQTATKHNQTLIVYIILVTNRNLMTWETTKHSLSRVNTKQFGK